MTTTLLQNARHRLSTAWKSVHVEHQGRHSVEKLQQLNDYSNNLSSWRMIGLFMLTPMPCLVLSLLKEVPPLNPPEAGVHDNTVFFVRSWLVAALIGASALVKMGQGSPRLKLYARQVAFISLFAAGIAVTVVFVIASLTVFPLPFGVLIVAFPEVLLLATCFGYVFGPRLKAEPTLWKDIKQQISVYNCQVALTFIYPTYIYGFVSLTGITQVPFVTLLPMIKLVARNWVSHSLADCDDVKPQYVIFIVEVFNALYVSNTLQSASSWILTATIMSLDLVHFCLSMLDVVGIFNELKALMAKFPRDHPVAKKNFLQVATEIIAIDGKLNDARNLKTDESSDGKMEVLKATLHAFLKNFKGSPTKKVADAKSGPTWVSSFRVGRDKNTLDKRLLFQGATVVPMPMTATKESTLQDRIPEMMTMTNEVDLTSILSDAERSLFVRKSIRVLFVTEYIVLVEYVEVVLPIVYSLYRVTLFDMHNRAYYPSMAGLSRGELLLSVLNMLAYSSLEFISLIISLIVLKRSLGFSTLRQLAFVLETHAGMIQATLIDIMIYVSQVPLAHLGDDFSFQFSWLRKKQLSG